MKNEKIKNINEDKKNIITQSLALTNKGKMNEAIELMIDLEKSYPDDIVIKQNLGMIYFKSGNTDKAIETYKKAIEINPSEFSSYHNLGLIYERTKNLRYAKIYYLKAVSIDPKAEFVLTRLGEIFFSEGNYEKAAQSYDAIIKFQGKEAENAIVGKALSLSRLGFKIDARSCLEDLENSKLKNNGSKLLAFLYLETGMIKEGIQANRKINGEIIFSTTNKQVKIKTD
jgi:tetratricopeptide (TPR) repeat protein